MNSNAYYRIKFWFFDTSFSFIVQNVSKNCQFYDTPFPINAYVIYEWWQRARYDNGHDVDDLEGHGHGFGADIDPNQIFQVWFLFQ